MLVVVVWTTGMEIVTGGETVVGVGVAGAAGIRAAALGISSLPIVKPVAGS